MHTFICPAGIALVVKMAQSKTSIKLTKEERDVVKELQDHFEQEIGIRPNQGKAVAIAGERILGESA